MTPSREKRRWRTCTVCGCEHYASVEQLSDRYGGPWCSRCRIHGYWHLCLPPREVDLEIRQAGRSMPDGFEREHTSRRRECAFREVDGDGVGG